MMRHLILVTAFLLAPHISPCAEAGIDFVGHRSALVDGGNEVPVGLEDSI